MSAEAGTLIKGPSRWALVVGAACLLLCALGWFFNPRQFFISYLFAELVWVGVALGCMAFLMIHYLTGGTWGWPVRRFFEAAARTLPLLGLLFIPIFFGLHLLYPWAMPARVAASAALQQKQFYLSVPFFIVRAVVAFAIWSWLAFLLSKWSVEQDATNDPAPMKRLRKLSGPGLVIYPLTVTVVFVDWVMSLEADWYSTMFPILICIGQMLSGLAFVILLLAWLGPRTSLAEILGKENFHYLGSLLLAFTMLWAYMSFSQLLVIWSGDLPHEISWYLHRISGGWRWVLTFLVLFHFFGPFFLLLSRQMKQTRRALATIAGAMFIAHVVDVWWMVAPSFYPQGLHVSWMDFAALLGIGGIWLSFFARNLAAQPLVPMNDPRFAVAAVKI
ncbi:MAG: hypothetical protein H0X40_04160 [Chthoniobacterales bacterium]|nr:hypothetical protein [Chthoniobacterales bacterium]